MVDKTPKFVVGRWLQIIDNLETRGKGLAGKRGKIVGVNMEEGVLSVIFTHIHTGSVEIKCDYVKETW